MGLDVQTTFQRLNGTGVRNEHLLPSDVWLSDHLAIGAMFCLRERSSSVSVMGVGIVKENRILVDNDNGSHCVNNQTSDITLETSKEPSPDQKRPPYDILFTSQN